MIDLHTHLLPGVDDGARTADIACQVLERFANEGVTRVMLTPHLLASRGHLAPYERHTELLDELRALADERAATIPELSLGWEIMLDRPGCDLTMPLLGLAGSHAVLVEFPRHFIPPGSSAELERIVAMRRVPVIAHPERYRGITLATVREWRELGAVIQTDATYLVGSGTMTQVARSMLEDGLVDILASDNHGDKRSLVTARTWLEEAGGADQAALLTETNPARLLAGEALEPVAPMKLGRGVMQRLRELVFGRR